ncbi:MAG: PspC domain-containing protein [Spirochaetaceae bacterium]|nr:PspC domain-containing protein [Spirochaetaceae bacterium]
MTSCERTARLYRSRRGMMFGVCQGIADWRGINAGYVRLTLVVLTVFTGFFPFGLLYLLAAFFLPLEPVHKERDFYRRSHIKRGFYDLRQEFDDLSTRFNRMNRPSTGSGTERDWDRRFNNS